jgi:putative intracellular protease/amidase
MNILMVLTSHERLGETGYRTGVWFDAFATSYFVLIDAGAEVTLASPKGGQPPIDPRSDDRGNPPPCVRRFRQDREARMLLADTLRLDQVFTSDFDAALITGGYGSMWDFAEEPDCGRMVAEFYHSGKPVALVCQGTAALRHAMACDGSPLVAGKAVTGSANSEQDVAGLAGILPFSLQDELIRLGAQYSKAPDGVSHVIRDGQLITAQNPASAADAATTLLDALRH